MARPKKKRGYRSIEVDNVKYRWRFKPYEDNPSNYYLWVSLANQTGQILVVHMVDWTEYHFQRNQPEKAVTNKLVANIIRNALSQGWKPNIAQEALRMNYIDDDLTIT